MNFNNNIACVVDGTLQVDMTYINDSWYNYYLSLISASKQIIKIILFTPTININTTIDNDQLSSIKFTGNNDINTIKSLLSNWIAKWWFNIATAKRANEPTIVLITDYSTPTNYLTIESLYCNFGSLASVSATYLHDTVIICTLPSHTKQTNIDLYLTSTNDDIKSNVITFDFDMLAVTVVSWEKDLIDSNNVLIMMVIHLVLQQ